jgi:hypothetical protein
VKKKVPLRGWRVRSRTLERFLNVGGALLLAYVAILVVVLVVKLVACARIERALAATAKSALGDRPDVAAIVSARSALVAHAQEAGLEGVAATVGLERRARADGPADVHVLRFEVHSRTIHADFEHTLDRLLDGRELHALRHEHIREAHAHRRR